MWKLEQVNLALKMLGYRITRGKTIAKEFRFSDYPGMSRQDVLENARAYLRSINDRA